MSASPETTPPGRAEPLRLPPQERGWAGIFWVLFGVVALAGSSSPAPGSRRLR